MKIAFELTKRRNEAKQQHKIWQFIEHRDRALCIRLLLNPLLPRLQYYADEIVFILDNFRRRRRRCRCRWWRRVSTGGPKASAFGLALAVRIFIILLAACVGSHTHTQSQAHIHWEWRNFYGHSLNPFTPPFSNLFSVPLLSSSLSLSLSQSLPLLLSLYTPLSPLSTSF